CTRAAMCPGRSGIACCPCLVLFRNRLSVQSVVLPLPPLVTARLPDKAVGCTLGRTSPVARCRCSESNENSRRLVRTAKAPASDRPTSPHAPVSAPRPRSRLASLSGLETIAGMALDRQSLVAAQETEWGQNQVRPTEDRD